MVAVGVISIGIAVAYERTAVVQQAARMHQIELRLQRSERLEMLGRMAAGIAHDFNNVLFAISGGVELARASVAQPEILAMELDGVNDAIGRAVNLTKQLTTFARTGRSNAPGGVGIDETLRADAGTLERLVGRERTLQLSPDAAGARVALDSTQVEQIVHNLVVNARDATTPGGMITVQTRIADLRVDRRVHDAVLAPGQYVCLSVVDTGAGIPPELLSRILEPFFTTKGEQGGTGIGLATVQQIVLSAHGDIEITSTLGAGSRFDVYLPVSQ